MEDIDGDAPAQLGGQRRPAAISANTLRCFSVFLFQVVRAYSGALDEGVKTAPIRPRHGRWRRLAEVVETTRSLSLFVLSVRRNVSRARQVVLSIGIKVVICSIPLSRYLFPLRSRRRESDNVVHIILPTMSPRNCSSFYFYKTQVVKEQRQLLLINEMFPWLLLSVFIVFFVSHSPFRKPSLRISIFLSFHPPVLSSFIHFKTRIKQKIR